MCAGRGHTSPGEDLHLSFSEQALEMAGHRRTASEVEAAHEMHKLFLDGAITESEYGQLQWLTVGQETPAAQEVCLLACWCP